MSALIREICVSFLFETQISQISAELPARLTSTPANAELMVRLSLQV